jgi:hypothetical protein
MLVVDEPDEGPRLAALAEGLAREFGLEARVERAEGCVKVCLTRPSIAEREVGDREETAAYPRPGGDHGQDLEDLDVVDVNRR